MPGSWAGASTARIYLIDQLTSLGESIASNGCLDEAQRECLFDHLGVDHVFRNGSQKVPAGSDGPGLAAVVAKEKARLTTKLERELNARDLHEQAAARLGILRYLRDQETRNLRGDQTRADRRVKWALQALADIQAGVDPATIIDNETGRPIKPEEPTSPAPAPEPAPPDPPAPTPPPAEASPSAAPASPFPDGLPEELKQIFLLVGEAYRRKPESSCGRSCRESPGPGRFPRRADGGASLRIPSSPGSGAHAAPFFAVFSGSYDECRIIPMIRGNRPRVAYPILRLPGVDRAFRGRVRNRCDLRERLTAPFGTPAWRAVLRTKSAGPVEGEFRPLSQRTSGRILQFRGLYL